jgi:hypothetical protein
MGVVGFERDNGLMEGQMKMKENRTINCGLTKPNNSWLGRWFLIKTFDNVREYDVAEIRRLLLDTDDDECARMTKNE